MLMTNDESANKLAEEFTNAGRIGMEIKKTVYRLNQLLEEGAKNRVQVKFEILELVSVKSPVFAKLVNADISYKL